MCGDRCRPNWKGETTTLVLTTTSTSMLIVQGQPIPESVQWIIICMGPLMSTEEISHLMQVGEHRVWGILAHFWQTGDVQVPKCTKDKVKCALLDKDVEVCKFLSLFHSCILKGPIIVLDADVAEDARLVPWQAEVGVGADSWSLRVSIHNMEGTN